MIFVWDTFFCVNMQRKLVSIFQFIAHSVSSLDPNWVCTIISMGNLLFWQRNISCLALIPSVCELIAFRLNVIFTTDFADLLVQVRKNGNC